MTTVAIPGHGDVAVPGYLLANIRDVHGAQVDAWLAGLGPMLADILEELDARLIPGDPPLSYHLVLFAERAGGEQIAIKCTAPNDEQRSEVAAVHALSDAGIGPRLLRDDLSRGVLVMERIVPGDTLPTGMPTLAEDAEITRAVAGLSTRIAYETELPRWRDELVPVREYSKALGEVDPDSELWRLHRKDIESAQQLRETLLTAPDHRDVLLHGDLHHYNVLRDAREGLRVIDPKGLPGPPGYDAGTFMYNPVGIQHHPDLVAITQQRVGIWSEVTGLPWETVRSWGYVAAVLSACWSGQGGGISWQNAMTVAGALRNLDPLS